LKVLVQLIGSDLATAEDADLMSAIAVGIRNQEQDSRRRSVTVSASTQDLIVAEAGTLLRLADALRQRSG
jgi:hypothetical protein